METEPFAGRSPKQSQVRNHKRPIVQCFQILGMTSIVICRMAAAAVATTSSDQDYARQVYYGDLHLHTSYSYDASLFGTMIGPDEAYRFAKGESLTFLGETIRRREPLDFLAVTDHSENIGIFAELSDANTKMGRSEWARTFRMLRGGKVEALWDFNWSYFLGSRNNTSPTVQQASRSAWRRVIEAANRYYEPGKFSTFIGFEWTAMPYGSNLHRNVIFKGATAPYPFTSLDSKYPEDLWSWLDGIRRRGFEAIAIPHNSNASNGLMYDWVKSDSVPITNLYASSRQRNEPLSEISQTKGSSETHPLLSSNDELANFEIYDYLASFRRAPGKVQGSYIRDALGRGLVLEREVGVNPYKFGFVGGSDFHSGLSISAQVDFEGDHSRAGWEEQVLPKKEVARRLEAPNTSAGSLTAVWAERNTRESIYSALRRKEVFATSGTKMKLRFFGGWGFDEHVLMQSDWIRRAYAEGVPMGGDLPKRHDGGQVPTFILQAAKDPNGVNLERIQVVKVWEENGQPKEKVFSVACAARGKDRESAGKPVLSLVDNCVNSGPNNDDAEAVGVTEFKVIWNDPEFLADHLALYYIRVLEIPSPRWSALLGSKYGVAVPSGSPLAVQQRGWSSPIWYTP